MSRYFGIGRLIPLASAARGVVVGSHNGKRSLVHIDSLDDEVVFHHEAAHETLFTTTIDGAILAMLWGFLDKRTTAGAAITSNLSKTAGALMESSRFAQEVIATYSGIKMVDPKVGSIALGKLPNAYRKYYRAASNVIDPLCKSTYLQVRMIRAIGSFTFRSCFARRFFAEPTRAWGLDREDMADWRLRALLEQLSKGDIESLRLAIDDWAAMFFAKESIEPWDLDSEDGWTANWIAAYKLDVSLDDCIDSWLRKNSPLPTLSQIDQQAAFAQLKAFGTDLGFKIEFATDLGFKIEEATPPMVDPAVSATIGTAMELFRNNDAVRVRSYIQAGSVIANTSLEDSLSVYRAEALWEVDDFANANKLLVVGMPSDQSLLWTVLMRGPGATSNITLGDGPYHAIRLDRTDVVGWLNVMAQPNQDQWKGVIPELIVVPFGGDSLAGPPAWSFDGDQRPGAVDGRLNGHVAMYLVGNWIEAIETALQYGHVDVTELDVEAKNYGSGSVHLTLKVARGEAIPGRYLLRVFGREASMDVDLWMFEWRSNPSYRFFTSQDNEGEDGFDLEFIEKALNAVLALWHQL